ncbi:redoxin domain-containing protein [Synechocystis salina LEGE 06099]|uniref:redoxin domain-containing protein n=1 Tax=Synechocystis salina TaxID=945780 RepID=UPI001880B961|nr:redoxin domain-containing protein [Synechocystis salina]MBE9203420.1 redoxin domain-containing protein [Synechocystis salina LEGE 06099]
MGHKLATAQPAPQLEIATLSGSQWKLSQQKPESFSLIVFYRGNFCPICHSYLSELDQLLPDFNKLGVTAIAISADNQEDAQQSKQEWELNQLTIGYGLTLEQMRNWALYVSNGEFDHEPSLFCEPGFFLVNAEGILIYAGINSSPFGRPPIKEMLSGIEFIIKNKYPIRGTR